jgi:hypothetical protein
MTIRGLRAPATVLRVVVFAEQDRAAMVAMRNHVGRSIGQESATEPSHCASPVGKDAGNLPNVPA